MSLGNLIEFPLLECLHLYRLGHTMAGRPNADFQDHKEYAIIWHRHMGHLREVSLCSDVVWRRVHGCQWLRTYVNPTHGERAPSRTAALLHTFAL